MSDPTPMIELRDVCKDYAQGETVVSALSHVDLRIEAGEYVAILGPSGSGKSTLLHVIGCLDTPSSGHYRLAGEDVSALDPNRMAEVRNLRFGFVFQAFHLMPRLSALDNVALPMRFAGLAPKERRQRASELLNRVGLADRVTHKPTELSGGQMQRVAIARALANEPAVLLADEPTGNLDSHAGAEIVTLLETLHRGGQTVVVITHDEALAQRTGRVIRMRDGAVVSDERQEPASKQAAENPTS